ncbi:hypothetical protein A5678_04580 [Mycobacterium sp. E2733]|nr:hypothetical protein A5678_04580 [Mycobacterium sp. E2733]
MREHATNIGPSAFGINNGIMVTLQDSERHLNAVTTAQDRYQPYFGWGGPLRSSLRFFKSSRLPRDLLNARCCQMPVEGLTDQSPEPALKFFTGRTDFGERIFRWRS